MRRRDRAMLRSIAWIALALAITLLWPIVDEPLIAYLDRIRP